jgi:hypothetical protein
LGDAGAVAGAAAAGAPGGGTGAGVAVAVVAVSRQGSIGLIMQKPSKHCRSLCMQRGTWNSRHCRSLLQARLLGTELGGGPALVEQATNNWPRATRATATLVDLMRVIGRFLGLGATAA